MIDVESKIYTPIATALRSNFSGISVSGEYVKAPAKFPHVTLMEVDNYESTDHLDNGDAEKYATVTFEANVYSNKTTGKKSECRSIMKVIDEEMYRMNFVRLSLAVIPNYQDATICRMNARYRAVTDGTTMYRR